MTQEEKQLLLKDLCGRVPYTPMVNVHGRVGYDRKLVSVNRYYTRFEFEIVVNSDDDEDYMPHNFEIEEIKPYLRSMSTMTEEERKEYDTTFAYYGDCPCYTIETFDFLKKKHFDYRDLIIMGLALEAPKGMYKTNKNERNRT